MDHHRVEVTGRRAPQRCVVCHDDLDVTASACEGCGAAFHADCVPAAACVTPACRGMTFSRATVAASAVTSAPAAVAPAAAPPRAAWDLVGTFLNAAVGPALLLLLTLGPVLLTALNGPRPVEDASARWAAEQEQLRRERRERELPGRLDALRAELVRADARKEPFRRMALEELRVRAVGTADALRAWHDPGMRQLFVDVGAAAEREGERATAEELRAGLDELLRKHDAR